jgi:UDP-N-acetylglucosamine transferase subunit ALG13
MRLFVTVGTQFPFDRLVRVVDQWLGHHPEAKGFGQIGPTTYRPSYMDWAPFIDAGECRRRVESATAVIAHAGMGSIITALELGKPIIVMPRNAALDEHRNDHQLATARSMLARGRVIVAFDEAHLMEKLDHLESLTGDRELHTGASPQLLMTLRRFLVAGEYLPSPADAQARPGRMIGVPIEDEIEAMSSPILANG